LDAQAHVTEKTKAVAAVGGWDVFHEVQQPGNMHTLTPADTAGGTTTGTTTGTTAGTSAGTTSGTTAGTTGVSGAEKSNLTGDVLGSLGEAGEGAVPVTEHREPGHGTGATGHGTGATSHVARNRTWVSITGWQDEEQHVESAKEITGGQLEAPREKVEATKNVYETMHLKKLLG